MLLPPGWRSNSQESRLLASVAFFAGILAGGSISIAALSVIGGVVSPAPVGVRSALLVVAMCVLVAIELRIMDIALPSPSRLVPLSRFSQTLRRGGIVFGGELGLGFVTAITHVGPLVLAGYVVATQPAMLDSLAIVVGWSIGRTSVLAAQAMHGWRGPQHVRTQLDKVLERIGTPAGIASAVFAVAGALSI